MSAADREKWNDKYRDPDFAPRQPSPVLLGLTEWIPQQGRALDLAGGGGRHSIWLAARGLDVTLADVSSAGLAVARQRAAAAGVSIQTLEHDFTEQGLPAGSWDFLLSICFLWQPTPELIRQTLAPGGVFVMIQPTTTNLERHAKPPRDFLLQPGELAARFSLPACAAVGLRLCHLSEDWAAEDLHDAVLVVRRE
jgi:tellurite methyltransferase